MDSIQPSRDDGSVLIDVIGANGRLSWVNQVQCAELGYTAESLIGLPAEAIYEPQSFDLVKHAIDSPSLNGILPPTELRLKRRTGRPLRTVGAGRLRAAETGGIELQLFKVDLGPIGQRLEQLDADSRLLRAILDEAKEAHWSIEFLEPVDLSQGRDEIVKQVFENESVWRMCNRAMSALYELPEDLDLNQQSVRLYWPRSDANEEFVRRLIESNFHIDGAVSVDRRHDGTELYVENDVRAQMKENFLYRIWGNCRNVSQHREAEDIAQRRLEALNNILEAVPDALVAVDQDGGIVWSNSAAAQLVSGGAAAIAQAIRPLLSSDRGYRRWIPLNLRGLRTARSARVYLAKTVGEDGQSLTLASCKPIARIPCKR